MAAHQAPPSLGFSRQEHWSGLPFSSPMHESEKWKWSRSVVSDLATPWTAAYQAPPSMGFFRQEYWSGVPLPSLVYMYRYIIICKTTRWSGYFPHFKVRKSRAQDIKNRVPGHTEEVKPGFEPGCLTSNHVTQPLPHQQAKFRQINLCGYQCSIQYRNWTR